MSLVGGNPCGKSERTISAGPKRGKIQTMLVLASRARRKTGSATSGLLFSLFYSVFFGFRGLLGGRYERKNC